MAGIKNKKLKGTTIVETLAAMVLIVITFGIMMMIYHQSINKSRVAPESRVLPILQSELSNTIEHGKFIDHTYEINGLTIEKTIHSYPNYTDTYQIQVKAFQAKKELMALHKIIYIQK